MLIDNIKKNLLKLKEDKNKEKLPFNFKEEFVVKINGVKNGTIQNT